MSFFLPFYKLLISHVIQLFSYFRCLFVELLWPTKYWCTNNMELRVKVVKVKSITSDMIYWFLWFSHFGPITGRTRSNTLTQIPIDIPSKRDNPDLHSTRMNASGHQTSLTIKEIPQSHSNKIMHSDMSVYQNRATRRGISPRVWTSFRFFGQTKCERIAGLKKSINLESTRQLRGSVQ